VRNLRIMTASLLAAFVTSSAAFADLSGDPEKGARNFGKCKSCHQIGDGAVDKIGPHLKGIVGRAAGLHDGFRYSPALKAAAADGLIWTPETLDAYIANPHKFMPKTRMSYRGMQDAGKRTDLIAYLQSFSDSPADIPEAEPTARGTDHDLDPAILAIQGDPEYGEYLASECLTCHKSDGTTDGIPSITLWPTEDFVIAMHAYKNKSRPHPVMQMLAGRLNDEEIAALAAYFETLEN
jgi:cytochrome c